MFKHDCNACKYLGSHVTQDHKIHDLYICSNDQSLVARFGDKPEAYTSMMLMIYNSVKSDLPADYIIHEAHKLYQK